MKRKTALLNFVQQILATGRANKLYGYFTAWQAARLRRLISDARFSGASVVSEYSRTTVLDRYEILWAESCVRDLHEEARRPKAEEAA